MNRKLLDELTSKCALTLSASEKERMLNDLTSILAFVDQIHTFPTEHVVPLTHAVDTGTTQTADVPESTKIPELHEIETTEFVENFFLVPKVIKT